MTEAIRARYSVYVLILGLMQAPKKKYRYKISNCYYLNKYLCFVEIFFALLCCHVHLKADRSVWPDIPLIQQVILDDDVV
jgi:hypothetical protein